MKSSLLSLYSFLLSLVLISCASDNVHLPEPGIGPSPSDNTYAGTMTTTVPDFPTFIPVIEEQTIKLFPNDNGMYTAVFEPFEVNIKEMGRKIAIGQMTINDIEASSDGNIVSLSNAQFGCQGGDYFVKGELSGTISESGITISIIYYPGSMPFPIKSVFEYK